MKSNRIRWRAHRAQMLATLLLFSGLDGAARAAFEFRLFLSTEGLLNPADTDGPATLPLNFGTDQVAVAVTPDATTRVYLWAQMITPNMTINGTDLAFRTTGNLTIQSSNIWQNNWLLKGSNRWNGTPGVNSLDPSPDNGVPVGAYGTNAVNVGTAIGFFDGSEGLANTPIASFDDQFRRPISSAVFGYIDVRGDSGQVHVIHETSGSATEVTPTPGQRMFLGFDDTIGQAWEVIGEAYDNASPEMVIIPEPRSGTWLLALLVTRLTRRTSPNP